VVAENKPLKIIPFGFDERTLQLDAAGFFYVLTS
jgi:hypothetical protein